MGLDSRPACVVSCLVMARNQYHKLWKSTTTISFVRDLFVLIRHNQWETVQR